MKCDLGSLRALPADPIGTHRLKLLERLLKAAEEGADRQRDRNPGIAGTRPPAARRHPYCSCDVGTRPDAGGAGGLRSIFVDEGRPMAQLLRAVTARGIMPAYTSKLPAAFAVEQQRSAGESPLPPPPPTPPLIEPLNQRELEVLRLFKTELSGPEIANVNNRRAAVKRAAEPDLL